MIIMNTNITGKYGNYVGEGIYSRSKNPDIYKIWMKILSKTDKDKSVVISSEWLNFQNFADWYYYNKIDLNPDVNYVIDTNILTWLSDSDQIIYSEDTCCLIPRQLYDSIKCCSLLYQRIYKSKLPVGVNFRGNLFEPTLGNRDNRKSLGLYKTPELAFYVYKYFKEQIIKEMADRFYSINALHEYVYECVYNLPIVSIQVSLDNYNPQEIESILEEKSKKPINPIQIFDYKKFHEGCIYNTKFGGPLIVLEYRDKFHVRIKFLDQAGYETIANIDNILSGNVKNPFALNKYGGYYGVGPYTSVQFMNVYKVWEGVLRRTNPLYNSQNSYSNTTISEEWRNFQNFADWYVKYRSLLNPNYIYHIDKDILQWNQKIKIYSSNTCCLVPKELNEALVGLHLSRIENLPVGVQVNGNKYSPYMTVKEDKKYLGIYDTPEEAFLSYKKNKESYIKELAEKYYKDHAITEDIYKILCNIVIEPFN